MERKKSTALFEEAGKYIPGGVNSPVRAFKSVGGKPVFMRNAKGAYLHDTDGNTYIDYINSWGPMILGHGHPDVVSAITEMVKEAISFGAPTEIEVEMAKQICSMVPGIGKVRLVSSGTEACMSAVRLARGYTGRNKILKFEGCYHGHADEFLVKAGSGVATFDIQTVPGVTKAVSEDTLTLPFNDIEAVRSLFENYGKEIAAVIVEPVAGNMGCIPPLNGFLETLRELCTEYGSVLIFDEVMTGFRLAPGGAQEVLGIQADILCFGKVIGGGMPVAAFAGSDEIMDHVAPVGKVYQAGTLSGNPVAVASGLATLRYLNEHREIYTELNKKSAFLENALHEVFERSGTEHTINRYGSMISVHFGSHAVVDFKTASLCDTGRFNAFFHHMLDNGVYLPPSAFETWFLSHALSMEDMIKTIEIASKFK